MTTGFNLNFGILDGKDNQDNNANDDNNNVNDNDNNEVKLINNENQVPDKSLVSEVVNPFKNKKKKQRKVPLGLHIAEDCYDAFWKFKKDTDHDMSEVVEYWIKTQLPEYFNN